MNRRMTTRKRRVKSIRKASSLACLFVSITLEGTDKLFIFMSGIQLGDKQVTLEDLDAMVMDKSAIQVDPSYLAKVCVFGMLNIG